MSDRKTNLQNAITAAIGTAVEVTVRGLREFTFSADGNALEKLMDYAKTLPGAKEVTGLYDEECDLTCVYFSV